MNFNIFYVGSLADALHKSASQVYAALRVSGVLNDYIIPCYDVLHTFSKEYLIDELTEVLKEGGIGMRLDHVAVCRKGNQEPPSQMHTSLTR